MCQVSQGCPRFLCASTAETSTLALRALLTRKPSRVGPQITRQRPTKQLAHFQAQTAVSTERCTLPGEGCQHPRHKGTLCEGRAVGVRVSPLPFPLLDSPVALKSDSPLPWSHHRWRRKMKAWHEQASRDQHLPWGSTLGVQPQLLPQQTVLGQWLSRSWLDFPVH